MSGDEQDVLDRYKRKPGKPPLTKEFVRLGTGDVNKSENFIKVIQVQRLNRRLI